MNHFPNPIRWTLALPDDVNLSDVDWSPVSTVETAARPRTGCVASPDKGGRGKAHTPHVQPDAKAKHHTAHSYNIGSDQHQTTTCLRPDVIAQVKGSAAALAQLETPRGRRTSF